MMAHLSAVPSRQPAAGRLDHRYRVLTRWVGAVEHLGCVRQSSPESDGTADRNDRHGRRPGGIWTQRYVTLFEGFQRHPSFACMSKSRTMPGGAAERASLPRGENQRALCRWCNLEVPPRRFTFCSDWCVHEWRLRTDPGYLRDQVYRRDRAVCALCHIDSNAAYRDLRRSRGRARLALLERWGLKRMSRSSLWDADHILPVAEGGGECDLANLRTLCLICHRQQTLLLQQRLRTSATQVRQEG
jgi:5-methylcytosine-specific restriction enzyme A